MNLAIFFSSMFGVIGCIVGIIGAIYGIKGYRHSKKQSAIVGPIPAILGVETIMFFANPGHAVFRFFYTNHGDRNTTLIYTGFLDYKGQLYRSIHSFKELEMIKDRVKSGSMPFTHIPENLDWSIGKILISGEYYDVDGTKKPFEFSFPLKEIINI